MSVEATRSKINDVLAFEGFTNDSAVMISYERALESARPDALFNDPYAKYLIGKDEPADGETEGSSAPLKSRGENLSIKFGVWGSQMGLPDWPEFHQQWTAVRTRFIDDHVVRFCGEGGVKQFVNMGSGFDMRPYRLEAGFAGVETCVELDMAVIQKGKQRVFEAMGLDAWFWPEEEGKVTKTGADGSHEWRTKPFCGRVHNVKIDLLKDDLKTTLSRSYDDEGKRQIFTESQPALFVAEGLIMYLGDKSKQKAHFLDPVSSVAAPGSALVLNFVSAKVPKEGEEVDPRTEASCFTFPQMREVLTERGWTDLELHSYGEEALNHGRFLNDKHEPAKFFSFVVARKK